MQSSKRRAWLTPDVEAAAAALLCRRFLVPNTPEFRQSVSGALFELTHSWNWEQYGTMTPDEAAAIMLEMYNEYALSAGCDAGDGNAPFWSDEEADDADDTEPPNPEFPWYEDAADWAVTAFLAVSFTPDAAIRFVTTARQIRFWFRKQDYGAVFRVLWDGVEVGEIDTYSATEDAGYFDYFAPTASEHVLRIEHTGTHNPLATPTSDGYGIEIIRGRLRNFGIGVRYNTTSGAVEVTQDDGATWQESPDADPRNIVTLPPRVGSSAQCDSAANAADLIRQIVETIIDLVTRGGSALFIAAAIATVISIFGAWWLLLPLMVAIAGVVIGIGAAGLTAAFTPTVWDTFECIVFCAMNEHGAVSDSALETIKANVEIEIGGDAADVLIPILELLGAGGLTMAGRVGGLVGDCSGCNDCPNCAVFNFVQGQQGFAPVIGGDGLARAGYVLHTGFIQAYNVGGSGQSEVRIRKAGIGAFTAERMEIDYRCDAAPSNFLIQGFAGGTFTPSGVAVGANTAFAENVEFLGTGDMRIDINKFASNTILQIWRVRFYNVSVIPSGSSPCE